MDHTHILHPIPPVWDENSRILILGSFPSVKSREEMFFYGHPQNRFWRVLSALLGCELPQNTAEKRRILLENGIALWDVIGECDIVGSSDASIKNVRANDISGILSHSRITAIFTNGQTAYKYYNKYIFPSLGIPATALPSTSPANAAFGLEKLCEKWRIAIDKSH